MHYYLLLALSVTIISTTKAYDSPITVRSDTELFIAINRLAGADSPAIEELIKKYHQHATPRLWQWLATQASFHSTKTDITHSLRHYKYALQIAKALKDSRLIALSHYGIARHLAFAGKHKEAITSYIHSCHISSEFNHQIELLQSLASLGRSYNAIGDYSAARSCAEEILKITSKHLNTKADSPVWSVIHSAGYARLLLANINHHNVHFDAAVLNYNEALKLFQKAETTLPLYGADICDALNGLGEIFSTIGNYRLALKYLNLALKLSKTRNLSSKEASTLLNLGALYLRQDNYYQASTYFRECATKARVNHLPLEQAKAILGLGISELRQGHSQKAHRHFSQSLETAIALSDIETVALIRQNIGTVLQHQGQLAAALRELNSSEKLALQSSDIIRFAEIRLKKAELYNALGRPQQAISLAQESAQISQQLGLTALSQLCASIIAQSYVQSNRPEQAIEYLSTAIHQLDIMRGTIIGDLQSRHMFFERRIHPYHLLIELLVDEGNLDKALTYTEQSKARTLLEYLHYNNTIYHKYPYPLSLFEGKHLNKEISKSNNISYQEKLRLTSQSNTAMPLEFELQMLASQGLLLRNKEILFYSNHALQAHPLSSGSQLTLNQPNHHQKAVLVNYLVTNTQFVIFITSLHKDSTKTPLTGITVKISKDELGKRVHQLHLMMAQRHPLYESQAREMYDLLVRPIEPYIQGAATLCIIPDDILWEVPFQVLQSNGSRFLVEDYSIFYAPSLSILNDIESRSRPDGASIPALDTATFLGFGNPTTGRESVKRSGESQDNFQFEPLPEAEVEVKSIGDLFSGDRRAVYTGGQAGESRFKAEAPNFDIIHLATHGVIDNANPMYSYLLLASGDGDGEDGLLEAHEILDLKLRADTVVLSACESARGRIGAGEGVVGLTWAFLGAGARTAVVSQWRVDSEATAEMMEDFYIRLRTGMSKPEAMRQTVLAMRRGESRLSGRGGKFDPRYHHPFYWAAFMVIGSPR
ncbi:MAG: CHAT domain-containing protein [Acidobacteria bacterium]|nr:CHAT domain-containing protein [Acidobacteriota bacterium]MCW5969193.1 CHAT domain-containing protein [Blastocatellales bacterium]